MIKFNVFKRFGGDLKFTADIDCSEDATQSVKLGLAVRWAIANSKDLSYANLRNASLDGANLRNASLDGANLDGANLRNASLDGSRLDGANLDGANLDGANLRNASLDGANLRNANLRNANLRNASLDGANLRNASLDGASLDGANLRSIRTDFFDILLRALAEVPALLATLRAGKINGSTYSGECACLCGTIANARHVDYQDLGFVDSGRPAERWFLGINQGDTPDNNQIAKITEAWILEFMSIIGVNSSSASVAA